MSTWTSDIGRAALFGAALLLGGCGGIGALGPSGTPPQRSVAVTSDAVVVTGPPGFCIDPTATRDRTVTAFVLLGNCAVISNRRSAGQPSVHAVLTASVSDADPDQSLRDSIPELDRFFRSAEGRGLLSQSAEAESVQILDSFHQGDVFFLHASDTSAGGIDDVTDEYWRSYLDVGERIVTLSVLGLQDDPISSDDGLATLREFTTAVGGANAGAGQTAVPVVPPPVNGTLWNVGLFRRIMGR